ncbi:solute carrier family 2, facilitated glucose transporter member 8-like [Amblyomma americanum]
MEDSSASSHSESKNRSFISKPAASHPYDASRRQGVTRAAPDAGAQNVPTKDAEGALNITSSGAPHDAFLSKDDAGKSSGGVAGSSGVNAPDKDVILEHASIPNVSISNAATSGAPSEEPSIRNNTGEEAALLVAPLTDASQASATPATAIASTSEGTVATVDTAAAPATTTRDNCDLSAMEQGSRGLPVEAALVQGADTASAGVNAMAVPSTAPMPEAEPAVVVAPDAVGTVVDARRRLYVAVAITYMASLSFGFSLAYSSPALPNIRKVMTFSESDSGWFGSLVTLGAVIGGLTGGRHLSMIGRRGTLIASSVWFMVGWLCLVAGSPKAALFAGRVLTGVGTGMVALAVTVFISEISPAELRGLLNTGANLVLCSGILVVFILGKFLNFWMLAVCCLLPSACTSVSLFWCHESPRWLLKNGHRDRAAAALRFYLGPDAATEMTAMESALTRHGNDAAASFSLHDLAAPRVYRSLLCVLLTMTMQQMSAIGVIIAYAQDIFEDAGTSVSAENSAIIVAAIQVIMVAIATVLADRLGRKVLLLFSSAVSSACLAVLGLSFHLKATVGKDFEDSFGWLPLVSLCAFFVGYAVGLGPLPWVLLGEMIPLKAKGFATGFCTATLFAEAFVLTKGYNSIRAVLGTAGTYWMFSSSLAGGFVLMYLFVPETKGKDLEQIERLFGKTLSSPRDSLIRNDAPDTK